MLAAEFTNLRRGGHAGVHKSNVPNGTLVGPTVSTSKAAQLLKVGRNSVLRARKVIDAGDDALIAAVKDGSVSVRAAAEVAELPKEERPLRSRRSPVSRRRGHAPQSDYKAGRVARRTTICVSLREHLSRPWAYLCSEPPQ